MFVRGPWVDWGTPLGTSDSLGVAGNIGVDPVCSPGRSVSLGLLRFAPGTSGSFGVAVFLGVCPGGCCLRWGSLGSLCWALVVIGFVRGRWVHCGPPFGVVCFVRGNWVHWGAPWESLS